jgi:hypothetical protein
MPARSASKQLARFNARARRIVGFGCPNMVYELATTSPIDLFKSPKCLGDFAFAIDLDKYLLWKTKVNHKARRDLHSTGRATHLELNPSAIQFSSNRFLSSSADLFPHSFGTQSPA